ncbi:hypothetical protein SAM23877_4343 [Streptomyces ambofaciens ATCC 23877]|uniref:Uncharacterized protein n=1 Tax=Streptomyces ambofaciens (strain ATCC 23877 / 3486 / DSM 40053 / JCM 4204 / NBRC 12836 / NRRL B-2516) TaxID=278992 RepID=A0A0K2AWM0_STRA7|nr:hypothetical protein [Streptomyces ambofaciens]AKZ57388.1 hypothetical protein SAM23877_4343 [Streptomyces ambofaciens ATCC 23877]
MRPSEDADECTSTLRQRQRTLNGMSTAPLVGATRWVQAGE